MTATILHLALLAAFFATGLWATFAIEDERYPEALFAAAAFILCALAYGELWT